MKLPASYDTSQWKGFIIKNVLPFIPHFLSLLMKANKISFPGDTGIYKIASVSSILTTCVVNLMSSMDKTVKTVNVNLKSDNFFFPEVNKLKITDDYLCFYKITSYLNFFTCVFWVYLKY